MTTKLSVPGPKRRESAFLLLLAIALTPRASSFPATLLSNAGMRRGPRSGIGYAPLRSSPGEMNGEAGAAANGAENRGGGGGRKRPARIPTRNLYAVLDATPSMSRTEIKRRYIALAKATHPDSSPSGETDEDRFNEIARAWSVLSDPKSRRAYDRELAAEDFKEGIAKTASGLAEEYGPTAKKLYDDFAIPFLRRTTATTLAGWSAAVEATGEAAAEAAERERREALFAQGLAEDGQILAQAGLAGVDIRSEGVKSGDALEDLGRAFQRAIEAGRNATRQIDGMELREKSEELRMRANETREESMEVLSRLTELRSERLRLTFHTSSANFTSKDVVQYLDGFGEGIMTEEVSVMEWMTSNRIGKDVLAFDAAESTYEEKAREKQDLDREMATRHKTLGAAEKQLEAARQAEERARKMLEDAQRRVYASEREAMDAKEAILGMHSEVHRAEQDLAKAGNALKRKRDIVRRQMKQKADKVEGVFNQTDGNVRLNPGLDRSSLTASEESKLEAIEALRADEQRIETEFSRLADKAGRFESRSERLRVRSEELVGEQDRAANGARTNGQQGKVIGDNFSRQTL